MKHPSYNIPAYKFAIVQINDYGQPKSHSLTEYEQHIKQGDVALIPFENVDGLTLEEVRELLRNEETFITCYYDYESYCGPLLCKHRQIVSSVFIDHATMKYNKNLTIDEVVEAIYEQSYKTLEPKALKACHCFFERYQDESYEMTKNRIKRIKEIKKRQEEN